MELFLPFCSRSFICCSMDVIFVLTVFKLSSSALIVLSPYSMHAFRFFIHSFIELDGHRFLHVFH